MKFFVVVLLAVLAVASAKKSPLLSRIINGQEAAKGEVRNQLMLIYNKQFTCGATLISNRWAITAAHCVEGRDLPLMKVRVNVHDVSSTDYDEYSVSNIVKNDMYNHGDGTNLNNVALLLLSTGGADLSRNVMPVASGSNSFAGDNCIISGYGVTESNSLASVLMKADVTVLSEGNCVSQWGSHIAPQHICVQGQGPNGSGACNADSGGPLICGGSVAGVASWGPAECDVSRPSVYSRMTYFRSWINANCNNCL